MDKEVQDDDPIEAPETEKAQDPSGEDITSSIHGDAEPSSLGNLTETSTERCERNDEKKEEDEDDGKKNLEDEDDDVNEDHPKGLEYAEVLMGKGSTALEVKDYATAAECYSRALEIRVTHFGELDQECFSAYYFYGFALLRNALGGLSISNEDGSIPADSCSMSCGVSIDVENVESEDCATERSDSEDSATGLKEDENEIDTNYTPNNDEDESDMDLAWKILDIARVIVEKRPDSSMDNVNVLCALAEINNYRDNFSTCLVDYGEAMNILEILGDPDLFLKAKTYYKMGLCVEIGIGSDENILYYERALSHCTNTMKFLMSDLDTLLSATIAVPDTIIRKKREEIAAVQNLSEMLKHKLQDEGDDTNNPPVDAIRGAVNALSKKVRKLKKENYCSSSSSSQEDYIYLGKFGGDRKIIRVEDRPDSFNSSPSRASDSSPSNSSDSVDSTSSKPSDLVKYSSPSMSSNSVDSSPSNSSGSDSDNPTPSKLPKLGEPNTGEESPS